MYSAMFKPSEDNFKHYVKATQIGTVRLDIAQTPPAIEGLCTDGLSACIGLLIKSQNGQRFSLTHTDLAMSEAAVLAECRWVGQPCDIIVVKGIHYTNRQQDPYKSLLEKTLPRLQAALTQQGIQFTLESHRYQATTGAVAINRQGYILVPKSQQQEFNRLGQAAPDSLLRHPLNMLHANGLRLANQYHPFDIQYDSLQWTALPRLPQSVMDRVNEAKTNMLAKIIGLDKELDRDVREVQAQLNRLNKEAVQFYLAERYNQAIASFEKFEKVVPYQALLKPLEIASLYFNLGSAYHKVQQDDLAAEHLQQAITIRLQQLGPEHELVKKAQHRLAECHQPRMISPQR